uniref:Uncharacterized protein n=1 Tax=Myoviridae sp. ctgXL3 TaxID=2826681 RepID=A0A8S5QS50_9CAUD|nr:MAG TPA: hypothetical protein [Myoviridae sp. ctgXL3]
MAQKKKEKRFNRQTRNEKKSNTKEKIINKRLIRKKEKDLSAHAHLRA